VKTKKRKQKRPQLTVGGEPFRWGRPAGTLPERVAAALDKLKVGTLLDSNELAELVACHRHTLQQYGTITMLRPYRFTLHARLVYWGHPKTVRLALQEQKSRENA
jgi:hypothetical protein